MRPGAGSERLTVAIPTLGASPLLPACLDALRRDGGGGHRLVVVHPAGAPVDLPPGAADEVLTVEESRGFAATTNRGLAGAAGAFVATVNDDLIVEPGWSRALLAALEADPGAAAAQGVNLQLDDPGRVDGCGLAWNRAWQAVQLHRGAAPPPPAAPPREIFGVSATAAVYRRAALEAVAAPGGGAFDARLGAYYEDVELACRLRAAGHRALLVPAARARHAGSATGAGMGLRRWAWIYGNRHLVLARHLGGAYLRRLPALAGRDLRDLVGAALRGEVQVAAGVAAGWLRAVLRLPAYARTGRGGRPLLTPDLLARFPPD